LLWYNQGSLLINELGGGITLDWGLTSLSMFNRDGFVVGVIETDLVFGFQVEPARCLHVGDGNGLGGGGRLVHESGGGVGANLGGGALD